MLPKASLTTSAIKSIFAIGVKLHSNSFESTTTPCISFSILENLSSYLSSEIISAILALRFISIPPLVSLTLFKEWYSLLEDYKILTAFFEI